MKNGSNGVDGVTECDSVESITASHSWRRSGSGCLGNAMPSELHSHAGQPRKVVLGKITHHGRGRNVGTERGVGSLGR